MKKLLVITLCVLSPMVLAKELKVNVQGMVCSMCAQGVQKKLMKVPGVTKTSFNLGKKDGAIVIPPSVIIITEGDKDLEDNFLKELIKEAGYNVASIERK